MMRCKQCKKEITSKPCPHCGSMNVIIDEVVEEKLKLWDDVDSVIIKASSQATIETEDGIRTLNFGPGTMSGEVAHESLQDVKINNITYTNIRDQITYNINHSEVAAQNLSAKEVIHENSFELNFGLFKYKWKRIK